MIADLQRDGRGQLLRRKATQTGEPDNAIGDQAVKNRQEIGEGKKTSLGQPPTKAAKIVLKCKLGHQRGDSGAPHQSKFVQATRGPGLNRPRL